VIVKSPATIDDLIAMPEDGNKYELVDGTIIASPAGMYHSEISVRIAYLIQIFLDRSPLGRVYGSDAGIRLPDGNVRSPDVCFVRMEKLSEGKSPDTFGALVPDLAVEVLSPSDRPREVADKVGEYLECGVPLVWLVAPREKSVTVYRSLTDTERLSADDTLKGDPVLPGFSCPVAKLF